MRNLLVLLGLIAIIAGCSGSARDSRIVPNSAGLRRQPSNGTINPIQHVIIIVMENRTPDNLFNGLPGADTVNVGYNHVGQQVPLRQVDLVTAYDLDHSHDAFITDSNGGRYDGFDLETVDYKPVKTPTPGPSTSPTPAPTPTPANVPYAFVSKTEVQPYWTMAQTYAFADRMFQSNSGPSFPAHQYLISGTAASDATDTLLVSANPNGNLITNEGGCDSAPGTFVFLINPQTNDHSQKIFPCFDHTTLMDALDFGGFSWKYYEADIGSGLWNAPDAIKHIRYGVDYAKVVKPNTQIISDISNGVLPDVSWVMPTGAESDHAILTDGSGPAFVASIVNALGTSRYWNSTAIIVTWDDWGGWYDHVAPPQYNYYELGFRVPLVAISPYARRGYVSHVQHEFGSIMNFVEETFGLRCTKAPPHCGALGYTDLRADDLMDMFNFTQTPAPFQPIPAPTLSAQDRTDRRIPDDD